MGSIATAATWKASARGFQGGLVWRARRSRSRNGAPLGRYGGRLALSPDQSSRQGFTLLEILVVLAIVGVLAAVALPSYSAHMRQSVAREGALSLLGFSLLQERLRLATRAYQPAGVLLEQRRLPERVQQHYQFSVELAGEATRFVMTLKALDPSAGYPEVVLDSTGRRSPSGVWP